MHWHGPIDGAKQMFRVATFDEIVKLGDALVSSGAGGGGIAFLISFVVVGDLFICFFLRMFKSTG